MGRHSRTILVAILLATLAMLGSQGAHAADPPDTNPVEHARPYVQPAVAYLSIEVSAAVYDPYSERYIGKEGDVRSVEDAKQFTLNYACTGFNVSSEGHIATAGHCVEVTREDQRTLLAMGAEHSDQFYDYPDSNGKVIKDPAAIAKEFDFRFRNDKGERGTNVNVIAAWDVATGSIERGKGYPARILDFTDFDDGDSALLKADVEDVLAVTIAKGDDIEVGEDIVAVGYPSIVDDFLDADLEPSYNDGRITAKSTEKGLYESYETSARVAGGMSGGPVVNDTADIVAHNSFSLVDLEDGSDEVPYVRAIEGVKELMASEGVKNSLDATSRAYKNGLDAYFDGDKDVAVEELTKVTSEQADNTVAEEFLKKSRALPDSTNWVMIIGIAVAGVIALAAVAFFLLRRRGGKAGGPGSPPNGPGPTTTAAPSSDGEAVAPQPAAGSTTVMDAAEPDHRSSGFQPTASAEPKLETQSPAVQAQAPGEHFCGSCGSKHQPDAKFCPSCGAAL